MLVLSKFFFGEHEWDETGLRNVHNLYLAMTGCTHVSGKRHTKIFQSLSDDNTERLG